jgi:hypothetical protein
MRVADVPLGLGRHEAARVFRRYVRDTRHHSASPRLRGEDRGEGACPIRDARFNARSVCKVTSAYGNGKLHTELTRAFTAWLSAGNRIPVALPQVRHGEWSRRDASDIDGLSREAERSGSELSQSVLWRTSMEERLWR